MRKTAIVLSFLSVLALASCGSKKLNNDKMESYTVKISGCPVDIEDKMVKSGGKLDLIDTKIDGYEFEGWYQDPSYTIPFDISIPIVANTVIFGKWIKPIYVSATGVGVGTKNDPCSLKDGLSNVESGDTLLIRGGVYNLNSVIDLNKNNPASKPISIEAYKNEEVVFDYGMYYSASAPITNTYNSGSSIGIRINGSHYNIKGLTIKAAGSNGMRICGSYNKVENCVFQENGNSGLQISARTNEWPHDNYIKNCTSFGSFDWNRGDGNQGEDADGFACKLTSGENNVFDGCISYNNSDDGWDLFTKRATGPIGAVTIRNCITFQNGFGLDGSNLKNGNGFKLGGRALEVSHNVYNCLAFNNKANGFDDNSNPGSITLANCTAYNNGGRNYAMGRFANEINTYTSEWWEGAVKYGPIENVPKSHNVFRGCISISGALNDSYVGFASYSLFYNSAALKKFSEEGVCNHTDGSTAGENKLLTAAFESLDLSIFDDLYNIHKNLRDEMGNIKLGNVFKATSEACGYGQNNRIGCEL